MTSMPSLESDLAVPVSTPKPPLLKRLILLTAVIAALVFAGLYATHWWTAGRFIEETDDAYIGGDVTVIGPKVAGYIEEVLVTDNQKVKAGDVLIRLDSAITAPTWPRLKVRWPPKKRCSPISMPPKNCNTR